MRKHDDRSLRAVALGLCCVLASALTAPAASAKPARPPQTGFEKRTGSGWTTHDEERAFLAAVDRTSKLAKVFAIGASAKGRPVHLVRLGNPAPKTAAQARTKPTALFVCTQHGNEPAGREACLAWLRDLAFTRDPALLALLTRWTVLFVPTANPDGRAANIRENSKGTDINRDHLNLSSKEAQAIGRVIRDWRPDVLVDLHEYGPGIPVLYDDDLLYLWPRNLNVDPQVHALGKTLAIDYVGTGAERAGYSSDEYGLYAVGDQNIAQTAGDEDEGILRNTAGLRHTIGILVETRVDMRLSPDELLSSSAVNLRRVASHKRAVVETLRFLREQGDIVAVATNGAPVRKTNEGKRRDAPVYFGGADNDPPEPTQIVDPPPCGYRLTTAQAKRMGPLLSIHAIETRKAKGGIIVPMGQPAEPLIPLLLDGRGSRSAIASHALGRC